jgi:hypothetical protein
MPETHRKPDRQVAQTFAGVTAKAASKEKNMI